MTKVKKTVVALLFVLVLLLGGLFGGMTAGAEQQNDLAVRYLHGKQTTAFLGESVKTAKATPVYPDKVDHVSYLVETPDGDTFAVENGKFTPEKAGEYVVHVCVVGNDATTYVESYVVSVTKSEKPIMTSAPVLPAAFIEGFAYRAPVAQFTDYNGATAKEVKYDVYYVDENGEETVVSDTFSPTISLHGEDIALKYVATSTVTGQTQEKWFNVPVLQALGEDEYGDTLYNYQNMFVTDGVSSTNISKDGCIFYGSNDFKVTYANLLKADGCGFGLASLKGMANFGTLRITITDSVDKNAYVTLDVSAIDENLSKIVVNSATTKTVNGSVLNTDTGFWFAFENDTLKLFDTTYTLITTVATTGSGEKFEGFKSNKVIVSVEAKSLIAKSALVIYEVNGQSFNIDYRYDRIKPFVATERELPIRYGVGDTIVIPKAYAIDIIDPTVRATVTVTDKATGMPITTVDGTVLDGVLAEKEYAFVVSAPSEYHVEYYAKDVNGRYTDIPSYDLLVRDETAPTLNVTSDIPSAVGVGSWINIPTFTYEDDYSTKEEMKTLVTISVPDGNYDTVQAGEKYTFDAVGVYHIRFTVIDAYFNMTTVEYVVECR
jgi:hypothetical protein